MAGPQAWRRGVAAAAHLAVALALIQAAAAAAAAAPSLESSPMQSPLSGVQTVVVPAPVVDYPKQVTVFRVGEQGCYFIRIPSIIRIGRPIVEAAGAGAGPVHRRTAGPPTKRWRW